MALNIASAARKRGWKGTGAAGGAVAIAEATADILRSRISEAGEGALLSSVAVAPNGFINFEADFAPSSSLVSTHGLEDMCAAKSARIGFRADTDVQDSRNSYRLLHMPYQGYSRVSLHDVSAINSVNLLVGSLDAFQTISTLQEIVVSDVVFLTWR